MGEVWKKDKSRKCRGVVPLFEFIRVWWWCWGGGALVLEGWDWESFILGANNDGISKSVWFLRGSFKSEKKAKIFDREDILIGAVVKWKVLWFLIKGAFDDNVTFKYQDDFLRYRGVAFEGQGANFEIMVIFYFVNPLFIFEVVLLQRSPKTFSRSQLSFFKITILRIVSTFYDQDDFFRLRSWQLFCHFRRLFF